MRIKYKLFISSLVIIAVFLLTGLFVNSNIAKMDTAMADMITAQKMDEATIDYLDGARVLQVGVYLTEHGDKEQGKKVMTEGIDQMAESRNNLRKILTEPALLNTLSDIERLEEKVVEASNDITNTLDNKTLTDQKLETLESRVLAFQDTLMEMDQIAEKNIASATERSTSVSSSTVSITYLGLLGAMLISIIISFFTASLMTKPISALTDVANKVSKGDIQAKITVSSSDEIGELAASFQRMVNAFKIMDALSREK